MLKITNLTNGPIKINYYISLKPYETKDIDITMNDNLANLVRINALRIINIDNNKSSNIEDNSEESISRSKRSKKNLEIESE